MHDGQICLPYPGGKLRLAHPSARYTHGVYRRGGTAMHVSPGLGTTFVPFRFFARPEATELVLRPACPYRTCLGARPGGQSDTETDPSYNRDMTGPARISRDVLARYAADAAQEVEGVRRLVPDRLRRHGGVRVTDEDDVAIEVHLGVEAGVSIPALGRELQQRIAEYLERMTGTAPSTVDVFVHEIGG